MGNISFLTGGSASDSQSIEEALYQLENCSDIFINSLRKSPPDFQRAGRVSIEAMAHLDHIVNEILRARDALKAQTLYALSPLETQLEIDRGLMAAPVTRPQQQALITAGAGRGSLPTTGVPIKLEKLLNKIKHRRSDGANYRINSNDRHIFVISVDKQNHLPDSIVEFDVLEFCDHCKAVAPLI